MGEHENKQQKTQLPAKNIVVMSANRYWLQGIATINKSHLTADVNVIYCHTLTMLRHHMLHSDIAGVVTTLCGDGETIIDWLGFREWCFRHKLSTGIILVNKFGFYKTGIITDIAAEIVSPALPVSQMAALLSALANQQYHFNTSTCGETGCHHLTRREMDFFTRLSQGDTVERLASQLSISRKTVGVYKYNVLQKLGIRRMALFYRICNAQTVN